MNGDEYFQENNRAFEAVVRLDATEPGSYNKEDIRQDIEKYARVSSLGKTHREAMAEIKRNLGKYGESPDTYPEAKSYGVVGQYGDGKTHFLTCLSDLLRNQNEEVYPADLNLLVLDPFNFPRNPVDIVEGLRERVHEVISPEAADRIPAAGGAHDTEIEEELRKAGKDNLLEEYEIRAIEGESAGKAFAKGTKEIVQNYKHDGIVLLMDEIEKISRESDIGYQELDRYREFFDEIGLDVPVYFIVTAPTDQWNHFDNIHSGAMDRMFGSEPRNHVQLQTLDETELSDTWTLRRDEYLRTDKSLPPEYDNDRYPLHISTLRAIHEISRRARSNRTAIELMKETYNDFLDSEGGWVAPGEVFEKGATATSGSGSIFDPDNHAKLVEHDESGVLTSVAGTLSKGIAHDDLLEVLKLSEDELNERLDALQSNSWIIPQDKGDKVIYRLDDTVLTQLEPGTGPKPKGDLPVTVQKVMANVDQEPNLLYRNLLQVLQKNDYFNTHLEKVRENKNYFTINSNFGNYHDRILLITTGDFTPGEVEEFISDENAELALAINNGDYEYSGHNRIIEFVPSPWETRKEYEVESLEYELGQWVSAYDSLRSELESGGRQMLNSIEDWVYQEVIGLDEFDLIDRVKDQFQSLYPKYPGPIDRINSQALNAYEEALERGKIGGRVTWKEIADDYGYAETENAITNYFDDWKKYGLAEINLQADPAYAELQVSESEELILDQLDEDDGTPSSEMVSAIESEGYRPDDIVIFIDLLKKRDKIREDENGRLIITTTNLTLARTYYDVVRNVAEWLTDDSFPDTFQNQYISNRDDIIASLGTCKSNFESLRSEELKSEGGNTVESFISDVETLQADCLTAIRGFENTEIAKAAFEIEQQIEELRDAGREEVPSSNEYMLLVDNLRTKAAELANSARGRFDKALSDEESSIFEDIQNLHDEFADKFEKTSPYREYNTEAEIQDIREQFEEKRPNTDRLSEAVKIMTSFEDKINYGKEIVRTGDQIMDNLHSIEGFESGDYFHDSSHDFAAKGQSVIDAFDDAVEENKAVGNRISEVNFLSIDSEALNSIQEEAEAASDTLKDAEEKQSQVDDLISEETRNIHSAVDKFSTKFNHLTENRGEEIDEMFAPKEGDSDVVDEAIVWWGELNEVEEAINDISTDIQQTFPETVAGIIDLEARKQDFDEKQEEVGELRNRMTEIHRTYFDEVQDELPPVEADSLSDTVYDSLSGGILAQIETLLDRIDQINQQRGIQLPPISKRIKSYVDDNGQVTPDELAGKIPDELFRETRKQVMQELTTLIQNDTLELTYDNGRVVVMAA